MICDLSRIAYERRCQFWSNGGPIIKIRWYKAPAGAKCLPFLSSFMSQNWALRPYEYPLTDVGEQWMGPPRWRNGRTPPTARGQQPFGDPSLFANGQVYDPNGPLVVRDHWGLAEQCTGMPIPDVYVSDLGVEVSSETDDD